MRARKRLAAAIVKQALADLVTTPLKHSEREFDRQVNRSTARAWLMSMESNATLRAAGLNPLDVRYAIRHQPKAIAEAFHG